MGLRRGDVIAVMLDNEAAVFAIAWAAERAGLYLTSVSTKLSIIDAAYILRDCGAQVLVVSDRLAEMATQIVGLCPGVTLYTVSAWQKACADRPETPIPDESPGADMLYSSGTTGRPKGIKPALPQGALGEETALMRMGAALYGMDGAMVYLSTSPLYHAAPLRWAMTVQRFGGTVLIMPRFDAETALALIERHRVTHGTWVPTHFVRLLKLPEEVRTRYDLSSQRAAIHAGAPCPVSVKHAMIDWWGPIIEEYYSGTEMCGITALSSAQWLERPGSVGPAVIGTIRILDDEGCECPAGQVGNIYFADGPGFEYHNDPAKTEAAHNAIGWATMGDIGHVDKDGFLFLTDRKNFMIISGGVNIYPQEIENVLITHPSVCDVAVIGVPDEELGETVLAVVQPAAGVKGDDRLAETLRLYARNGLGGVKTPKHFEFRDDPLREPTGKLLKAKLIAEFKARGVAAGG
jgi:long-chain acyl-CoA synthetase